MSAENFRFVFGTKDAAGSAGGRLVELLVGKILVGNLVPRVVFPSPKMKGGAGNSLVSERERLFSLELESPS